MSHGRDVSTKMACDCDGMSTVMECRLLGNAQHSYSAATMLHLFPASGCNDTVCTWISNVLKGFIINFHAELLRDPRNKVGAHKSNKYIDKCHLMIILDLLNTEHLLWNLLYKVSTRLYRICCSLLLLPAGPSSCTYLPAAKYSALSQTCQVCTQLRLLHSCSSG